MLSLSGLQTTWFRIKHLSGRVAEWALAYCVPILVKSSLRMGMTPSSSWLVYFLPMPPRPFSESQSPALDPLWPAMNIIHPRPVSLGVVAPLSLMGQGVIPTSCPLAVVASWNDLPAWKQSASTLPWRTWRTLWVITPHLDGHVC